MFYSDKSELSKKKWASIPVGDGPWVMNLTHTLAAIGGPVNGIWILQIRCPYLELPTRQDLQNGILVKRPYTAGSIGARCGTGGYASGYKLTLGYSNPTSKSSSTTSNSSSNTSNSSSSSSQYSRNGSNYSYNATNHAYNGGEVTITRSYNNGRNSSFETPPRLASGASYFPAYEPPQREVWMAPSEVKHLYHMQPKSGTGWMPACIKHPKSTPKSTPTFMFPFVSPATAPGLHNPITLLKDCDDVSEMTYDQREYVYVAEHSTYLTACKAVEENPAAKSVIQRLHTMGHKTSEIFGDVLKCGDAITGDHQTLHALTPFRDLQDGQGSNFNVLVDYRTSPVPSLMSYLYLDILRNSGWLDDLTVQVEVVLITYNPNVKYLSQIVVTFQVDIVGKVSADFVIESILYTLHPHDLESGFRFALEVLVMITVVASVISEIRDMLGVEGYCTIRREHLGEHVRRWWQDGWNVVDTLRIVLFIIAIIVWANLWMTIDDELTPYIGDHSIITSQQYSKTRNAFDECVSLLNLYAVINGFNLMVHLFWILKYFRHPRLAVIRKTIARSGDDLAHFGLIFGVIFGTYTVMANLFFGKTLEKYASFGDSLQTCLLMVLGEFDYWAMREAWPLGAYIFFWTFIFLCSLILFNMIIGIVLVAYDTESSHGDDSNVYSGLRDTLWHRIRYPHRAHVDTGAGNQHEHDEDTGAGNRHVHEDKSQGKISLQLNEIRSDLYDEIEGAEESANPISGLPSKHQGTTTSINAQITNSAQDPIVDV